jgi:hypothetical protein
MDLETLSIGIKGLESELKILKEALGRLNPPSSTKKVPHFADLCGVWKGKFDLSFEEIAEAKYRPKPFPTD